MAPNQIEATLARTHSSLSTAFSTTITDKTVRILSLIKKKKKIGNYS